MLRRIVPEKFPAAKSLLSPTFRAFLFEHRNVLYSNMKSNLLQYIKFDNKAQKSDVNENSRNGILLLSLDALHY